MTIVAYYGMKKYVVYTNFDTTLILFKDIRMFSSEHGGALPNDWGEFVSWHDKKKLSMRWNKEDLDKRFTLKWGIKVENIKDDSIILEVHDPVLSKYLKSLNKTFVRRLLGTRTNTNNPR
jgi:hypothetical protein